MIKILTPELMDTEFNEILYSMLSKSKLSLSTFDVSRSTGDAVVIIFPEILVIRRSWFLFWENVQKTYIQKICYTI